MEEQVWENRRKEDKRGCWGATRGRSVYVPGCACASQRSLLCLLIKLRFGQFSWVRAPCPMCSGVGGLTDCPAMGLGLWDRDRHQRHPGCAECGCLSGGALLCLCVYIKEGCGSSWSGTAAGKARMYIVCTRMSIPGYGLQSVCLLPRHPQQRDPGCCQYTLSPTAGGTQSCGSLPSGYLIWNL